MSDTLTKREARHIASSVIGWIENCGVSVHEDLLYREDGEWVFAVEVLNRDVEDAKNYCEECGIVECKCCTLPDDKVFTRIYGKIKYGLYTNDTEPIEL